MENQFIIQRIRAVYEGELNPGHIAKKPTGRHSDCFVLFLQGGSHYTFDGYAFTATPDNFIYLAKNSRYAMDIGQKSHFICIDFDFNTGGAPQKSAVFQGVSTAAKNEFLKAFYAWNKKGAPYPAQTFASLYALYAEAIRLQSKAYAGKSEAFSEMTSFILSHYTEPGFSAGVLTAHTGFSAVHIRRIFKNAINSSPAQYISYLRLEKAKNMLTASNYTVAEVAASSGFEDPYYFSRLFKRSTGLSPSEYRKQAAAPEKPNR